MAVSDADYNDYSHLSHSLFGYQLMTRISREEFLNAASSGNETIVQKYIAHHQGGYDYKQMCKAMDVTLDGESALHLAAKNGHVNVIHLLLQTDIDVNARGRMGNSALHEAVEHDRREVVTALLANDRVITAPLNDYMHTPLSIAVRTGSYFIAKALFESGAFTSQYDHLLHCADIEVTNYASVAEKSSPQDKSIYQLFLRSSIAMRDLLLLHKERFDFRKELITAGVILSRDALRTIHTMPADEFADLKEMAEFVKNSGEFNPEAVSAAFSTPRLG